MKVLVCGDRNWKGYGIIRLELMSLPDDTIIVHGSARGADTIAGNIAKALGFEVHDNYKPNWKTFGDAAGPIRNKCMLEEENPDLILAFHNNIENSKGTKHMVKIARKAGKTVKIITG